MGGEGTAKLGRVDGGVGPGGGVEGVYVRKLDRWMRLDFFIQHIYL